MTGRAEDWPRGLPGPPPVDVALRRLVDGLRAVGRARAELDALTEQRQAGAEEYARSEGWTTGRMFAVVEPLYDDIKGDWQPWDRAPK